MIYNDDCIKIMGLFKNLTDKRGKKQPLLI